MTSSNSNRTALAIRTKGGVKFGKEMREKEFLFQERFINLNHGEYAFLFLQALPDLATNNS
jgi:hypothetical protein